MTRTIRFSTHALAACLVASPILSDGALAGQDPMRDLFQPITQHADKSDRPPAVAEGDHWYLRHLVSDLRDLRRRSAELAAMLSEGDASAKELAKRAGRVSEL